MPFLEPEEIAERIVTTLERPRFDVPVPRSTGVLLSITQALPFRARAALSRLAKANEMFDTDEAQRADYAARLLRGTATARENTAE